MKNCVDFSHFYPEDIGASELYADLVDFTMLQHPLPAKPLDKLKALLSYGKDIYPAATTAYRLLLTLPISVASCERSFSKLKLIETYLRSTLAQDKLTSLALLGIEHANIIQRRRSPRMHSTPKQN